MRVVTAQPIDGAAGIPVVHTYTIVVRYSADFAGIELPVADTCIDDAGYAPHGAHPSQIEPRSVTTRYRQSVTDVLTPKRHRCPET